LRKNPIAIVRCTAAPNIVWTACSRPHGGCQAQEAEKQAIDEGFESAEILSKEVEDLTAELEEVSVAMNQEKEEIIAENAKAIEKLRAQLEVELTDHTFLKRQYETLEGQYQALVQDGGGGGGGGLFGGDADTENKLNAARADLLKANKTVHQMELEKTKLMGDLTVMQKEVEQAQQDSSAALEEADSIKQSMANDLQVTPPLPPLHGNPGPVS
jgi:chromosome segregation ATPase